MKRGSRLWVKSERVYLKGIGSSAGRTLAVRQRI
jgi:hypothetical protein